MTDYIKRADAIDAVAEEWLSEASAESPYVNDDDIDRYRELAEELFADIPSADAESDDLIIKGAKGIQDGLYNIKDGKLFMYKANGGTVRTYPIVPSADAVSIHNDGTLEVKVPNAQRVGRVLVMDTDSHIGGGLFYPDDAEAEFADLPDIPRTYYEKIVGNMAHEINMLKEQLESADAVHGEWICKEREYNDCDGYYAHYWYECSVCGARPPKNQWKNEWHSPYCPSCGARMKGGDDK